MLAIDDLHYRWPEGRQIFADLSLNIRAGEKLVLLGANGCGKSTLLKLMNGLIFPDAGQLRFQGELINRERLQRRDVARKFRRECALLFQHPEAMLFNPTVRDEIAYSPRQLGLADSETRVTRWANALRIASLLDQPSYSLSGGEKQKVALACILALEPALMLLDEPAASLDPRTAACLVDTLSETQQTVVISTHNLSMAAELGSRCIVFSEAGEILFEGAVHEALADLQLLEAANLAHRHRHHHGAAEHSHVHLHNWEAHE